MGRYLRTAAVVVVAMLAVARPPAHASPQEEVAEHTRKAMEHFDTLDYELAKKLLLEAVVVAKRNRLTKSKALGETYVYLGIVYFAGFGDVESAKLAFMDAVSIDPDATLDDAYRTTEMQDLLDAVRAEAAKPSAGPDCASLTGVVHDVIDATDPDVAQTVNAAVAPSLNAAKVGLHYRPDGATKFKEVKMERVGECTWKGTIPGKAVQGPMVHYYVAAHDATGLVLAGSGSRKSPHLIEVDMPPAVDDVITRPVEPVPAPKKKRVFLSLAVGTGGGYVSGRTEQVNANVECCFAPAVFHVFPEIGYYVSPQMSISAAFRVGFPVDANRMDHSNAAPSAVLRLRYAIAESGDGLLLNGAIGAGVIRHTVKLSDVTDGMGDVDTSASGPLLIGFGAGYSRALSGSMKFLAELNVLSGIPVVDEFSGVEPNFALQLDANVGLLVAF
jgi:hypothetical protein